MENTNVNNNNNTREEETFELGRMKFVPNYSVQYVYDADLAKVIVNNLQKRFGKYAISISIVPVKDIEGAIKKSQCPIQIFAQFALNKEMFKATINPKIARMINAEEEYGLTADARTKLSHFLSKQDLDNVEVKTAKLHKKLKCTIVSIKLNPYLTLSNSIEIPEGNVFDIMEVRKYGKQNVLLAIRSMKRPTRNNNHNRNNNNRNDRNKDRY